NGGGVVVERAVQIADVRSRAAADVSGHRHLLLGAGADRAVPRTRGCVDGLGEVPGDHVSAGEVAQHAGAEAIVVDLSVDDREGLSQEVDGSRPGEIREIYGLIAQQ